MRGGFRGTHRFGRPENVAPETSENSSDLIARQNGNEWIQFGFSRLTGRNRNAYLGDNQQAQDSDVEDVPQSSISSHSSGHGTLIHHVPQQPISIVGQDSFSSFHQQNLKKRLDFKEFEHLMPQTHPKKLVNQLDNTQSNKISIEGNMLHESISDDLKSNQQSVNANEVISNNVPVVRILLNSPMEMQFKDGYMTLTIQSENPIIEDMSSDGRWIKRDF